MKKLLRSKANFDILEGFLSELLKENIHILEILESENPGEWDQPVFKGLGVGVSRFCRGEACLRPFQSSVKPGDHKDRPYDNEMEDMESPL
ncbi:MAG: hypothetical protein D3911_02745 [Candidatus Electrothrix sp. AW3_4]|nr:hypothetical protein [Candidatus Electrothrix gigas]